MGKLEKYQSYRIGLKKSGISSFKDNSGRIYTACNECNKKGCKAKRTGSGCMIGETEKDVLEKIKQ